MSTTITSTALGYTLIAETPYTIGDIIFPLDGTEFDHKNRYSIQIGNDTHMHPFQDVDFDVQMTQCPWIVTNHSCDPNVKIDNGQFVAIKEIHAGEPITFDYETTEWEMDEPFSCGCGASTCRGQIRGYRFLSDSDRQRSLALTASHLLNR